MHIIVIETKEEFEEYLQKNENITLEFTSDEVQVWYVSEKKIKSESCIEAIHNTLQHDDLKDMTMCQIRFHHLPETKTFKIEIGNMTIRHPEDYKLYRVFKEYFEEIKNKD